LFFFSLIVLHSSARNLQAYASCLKSPKERISCLVIHKGLLAIGGGRPPPRRARGGGGGGAGGGGEVKGPPPPPPSHESIISQSATKTTKKEIPLVCTMSMQPHRMRINEYPMTCRQHLFLTTYYVSSSQIHSP
jgi:hypothetical protein